MANGRAMNERHHNRQAKDTLRNDHCSGREQNAERSERTGARQQQIDGETNDDGRQAEQGIDRNDKRPPPGEAVDRERGAERGSYRKGAGARGQAYRERQKHNAAQFGIECADQ